MSPGPKGKGHVSRDSYDGDPPNSLPPAAPKQINASDAKFGPIKPGSGRGAGINLDTFHE